MPSRPAFVVVLGTGGTISALAESPGEQLRYRAGEVGIEALAAGLSGSGDVVVETEQVAQVDSKDMDFAVWRRLAERVAAHLARPEVRAVVVTHGTDTMEETAWFLQRVLAPAKPVVLTGAMRPASSSAADGPRNLAEAVEVASTRSRGGVVVSFAGWLIDARSVRKQHSTRLDAFVGRLDDESRDNHGSTDAAIGLSMLPADPALWPYVAIVASTAGADPRSVDALVDAGVDGLVIAATGNGTIHRALEPALARATAAGVAVLRASRCEGGGVVESSASTGDADSELRWPSAGDLSPPKARVELLLQLLAGTVRRRRA